MATTFPTFEAANAYRARLYRCGFLAAVLLTPSGWCVRVTGEVEYEVAFVAAAA